MTSEPSSIRSPPRPGDEAARHRAGPARPWGPSERRSSAPAGPHPAVTGLLLAGIGVVLGVALATSRRRSGRPSEDATRSGPPRPILYRPEVEQVEPDEQATFERIAAVMAASGRITRERHGRAVRTSHAKAHGLLGGELRVLEGLAPELRQGLFARGGTYPVVVRLAHVPGELLDDRTVSCPRGLAIKVLGVEGEMIPPHRGERTQDWVLDTGRTFIAPGAKTFLAQISATDAALPLPEAVKGAVSRASRAANAALNAVGLDSANLDFYGHPALHPLGESYFSQTAMRYGDHVAKLGVFPDTRALQALIGRTLDLRDRDGLRGAVVEFFRANPAEYVVGIQLCTSLERMPVEDASVEWPEDESPYRPVARLVLPAQDAYAPELVDLVDESLSFCPAHSLEAHRPLGSINRARMHVYEVLGRARREANGRPLREPHGPAEAAA